MPCRNGAAASAKAGKADRMYMSLLPDLMLKKTTMSTPHARGNTTLRSAVLNASRHGFSSQKNASENGIQNSAMISAKYQNGS